MMFAKYPHVFGSSPFVPENVASDPAVPWGRPHWSQRSALCYSSGCHPEGLVELWNPWCVMLDIHINGKMLVINGWNICKKYTITRHNINAWYRRQTCKYMIYIYIFTLIIGEPNAVNNSHLGMFEISPINMVMTWGWFKARGLPH